MPSPLIPIDLLNFIVNESYHYSVNCYKGGIDRKILSVKVELMVQQRGEGIKKHHLIK